MYIALSPCGYVYQHELTALAPGYANCSVHLYLEVKLEMKQREQTHVFMQENQEPNAHRTVA